MKYTSVAPFCSGNFLNACFQETISLSTGEASKTSSALWFLKEELSIHNEISIVNRAQKLLGALFQVDLCRRKILHPCLMKI